MTIRDLINLGIKKLSTSTSPALDTEVLLSHVLDKPKEYLLSNPDKPVSPKIEKQFKILLNRRLIGWPVPYITKNKEFGKLNFYVDKNVLIPRPETEGLIELVMSQISKLKSPIRILDIGTGSGNIIISLAKQLLPDAHCLFFASDLSAKALVVAKKNAQLHKAKITFKQGSLMEPWNKQHFDVIVANLPYLEKETDSSTHFEPKNALIAKSKGLSLYEQLFKQISILSPKPYTLFFEIGHNQGLPIKKLAKKFLPAFRVNIYKDMFGKSRFAVLQL
jgi:release factor glutamine methyltransferase